MDYDVFISHKSDSKPWCDALAHNLKEQGLKVFYDQWVIRGGIPFANVLYDGLKRSRKGLLVCTPDVVSSGWVKIEYDVMLNRMQSRDEDHEIIPIRVSGELPEFPFLDTLNHIEFESSDEVAYRRAFAKLLSAIRDESPGDNPHFDGELRFPEAVRSAAFETQLEGSSLVERVRELLDLNGRVVLCAQDDRFHDREKARLVNAIRQCFGEDNVYLLTPPFGLRSNLEEYFAHLGRQAGIEEPLQSSDDFVCAFGKLANDGVRRLVIVHSFENGMSEGRVMLARAIRSINEEVGDRVRFLILGGEKLSDIVFTDELSGLNDAEYRELPELSRTEFDSVAATLLGDLELTNEEAKQLVDLTGGHLRLLEYALMQVRRNGGFDAENCRAELKDEPYLWKTFLPFAKGPHAASLRELLEKEMVGASQPYIFHPLLKNLFWRNLLKRSADKRHLVWRSELIRETGRSVLDAALAAKAA